MPKNVTEEVAAHPHGRVPRELRRRQALSEARALFVEKGYHGASMDELARRMKVSKPVVYDLAGSKDQLFHDVMELVGEELATCLAAAVVDEVGLERRLHAGIRAFLGYVHQHRAEWQALLSSVAMGSGRTSAEAAALKRAQVLLVASFIAGGDDQTAERLGPLETEAIAQAINGAVESVALWWQDHPTLTPDALASLLTGLLAPGLLALAAGPGRAGR